jgi:DNA-binding transcriptional MerR regulator
VKGAVFDTRRHSNVKRKAAYRRIGKNFKGLEKFKAEKRRRKQILQLQDEGLRIKEIAARLQVSERTVKRDLAKVKPYVKGQWTRFVHQEDEKTLEWFTNLSLKKQIEYITELQETRSIICKTRQCSDLQVTIDVDAALEGRYAVSYKPHLPVDMLENGKITLNLVAHGRKQAIARIYVGKTTEGTMNLQTNQSMNVSVKPVLKGLQVVETEETNQKP